MVSFKVNGEKQQFSGDPDMPLLWYLREDAGKKGTKFGCGIGQCGACTVHVNGAAMRSCSVPMSALGVGDDVTTIEGLADGDKLHAVQQAWVEEDVPQCGYCQSGQLMSASALLATNVSPTDADIDSAMSGNACRCGTYPRIKAAIHHAADNLKKS